ncbi:rust resistance kinase Lr10-like isoform X2 [Humulus lupulus]|uniref:rust resistance kinase Lr10-like isoform X2 n=1 Tax=Humulus lupulus TaxID=3486 RepID=UPI002B401F78|nr:rust resistance kinase Lr10-like isoform X2 [Humulus lupulus]
MMVSMVTSRGGLLLFSIIILLLVLTDQALGGTAARRCSQDEPPIRFPFRFVDEETDSHAYPVGFDISCSYATFLNLPSLDAQLEVTNIDYVSQEIQIEYDPLNHCLLTLLLLSENKISSSRPFKFPFQFKYDRRKNYTSYAVFNCSSILNSLCTLGLLPSNDEIFGDQTMGCTKMYDTQSIPDNIWTSYSYSTVSTLTWAKPDCRSCEANRMGCRFKLHSHDQVECFHIPIHKKVVVLASSVLSLMAAAASFYLYTIYEKDKEYRIRIGKFLEDYIAQKPSRYTYSDIKKITNRFKEKLGEGAYGTVFKGKLSNEILVAVKILNNSSKANNGEEFLNEVATIGQIHHVNVVRLVGYCAEGFRRALIYEFLPNGSLHNYISLEASRSGDRSPLGWEKLQEIVISVAKGIEYLHQGCDQRILHFDIKPHNVLLDHNFKPKISDFGLAKLCSKDQSLVSMTTVRGTAGYMAPEVFSKNFGNVSYKADVYSFGMLLLEIVGRRKNTTETDEIYYPEWIYNLLEGGEDLRIQIENEEDNKIAKKLAIVGLWCIQWHSMGRPTMKVVVQMLEGEEALHMPPNPFVSTGQSNTHTTIPSRIMTPELETIVE